MRLNFPEKHAFLYLCYPPVAFPMVPVRLVGHRGQAVDTFALLDSGADCCMFHANWARRIGLDLYAGRPGTLSGIDPNSPLEVYYHRINLVIGNTKVRCNVAFSEGIGEEMNDQLVGREIVFNQMRFAIRQRVLSLYAGPES